MLYQFLLRQLLTLSTPTLSIPIWSMLTKWELTKWEIDQMGIDKVGIDKVGRYLSWYHLHWWVSNSESFSKFYCVPKMKESPSSRRRKFSPVKVFFHSDLITSTVCDSSMWLQYPFSSWGWTGCHWTSKLVFLFELASGNELHDWRMMIYNMLYKAISYLAVLYQNLSNCEPYPPGTEC